MPDQITVFPPAPTSESQSLEERLRRLNPSALPVGPASLVTLLVATIRTIEADERESAGTDKTWPARLVVSDIYRRLTSTERFRLHSALHADLCYVPTWVQEITS